MLGMEDIVAIENNSIGSKEKYQVEYISRKYQDKEKSILQEFMLKLYL